MIPFPYVLRRRMMVSGGAGGGKGVASLAPASGVTYTNGLVGLTAEEVSAMSALISNEPTITKDAQTVYVDFGDIHRKLAVTNQTDNQIILPLNGTNYAFDILGFNHDTLTTATAYGEATATGMAGITLQIHDLFATTYPMNSSNTNSGGWKNSVMRTSTMATMKNYLPSAWRSIIKPVNKASGTGGGSSSGTETVSDSCFLLADIEVFGSPTYSVSGEGSQYAYYKAGNSKVKRRNGSAVVWWNRSPYKQLPLSFTIVDASGAANANFASYSNGVAFAFCV